MNVTNALNFANHFKYAQTGNADAAKSDEKTRKNANGPEVPADSATAATTAVSDTDTAETAVVEDEQDSDDAGSTGTGIDAKSILEDFRKSMNDQLLKSLGLGSAEELAAKMAGAGVSSLSISVQFELSYQSFSSVSGAATGSSFSLSLSASLEFTGAGAGLGSNFNPFAPSGTDGTDSASGTNDLMSTLKDLFSPEKTAQRILDFSLGFFGQSSMFKESGDTTESRSSFADMMGKAIQKGFDQALGILGDLPDNVADEVDQTHSLVFQGLDNFVNALNQNKDSDSSDSSGSDSSYSNERSAAMQDYFRNYQAAQTGYSSFSLQYSSTTARLSSGANSLQATVQQMQSSYSYSYTHATTANTGAQTAASGDVTA